MREMKFRAWDKEYKFMYQNAYPFEHLVYVEMHDDDETFQQFKHKMQVVNGKYFYWIIAKDIEVMQFTGLIDKDGKEIYEGDMVLLEGVARGYVRYGHACYLVHMPDGHRTALEDIATKNIEVIGNICEHPHLLEVL